MNIVYGFNRIKNMDRESKHWYSIGGHKSLNDTHTLTHTEQFCVQWLRFRIGALKREKTEIEIPTVQNINYHYY